MNHTTRIILEKMLLVVLVALLFVNGVFFGRALDLGLMFLFIMGLTLGILLLELDELVFFRYYQEADSAEKQSQLMTRSLVFMLALAPLGLFLMTSTGSFLGVGLFLGIVSSLSVELIEYRTNHAAFKSRFMQQLQRELTVTEQQWFVIGFCCLGAIFALLIAFTSR